MRSDLSNLLETPVDLNLPMVQARVIKEEHAAFDSRQEILVDCCNVDVSDHLWRFVTHTKKLLEVAWNRGFSAFA